MAVNLLTGLRQYPGTEQLESNRIPKKDTTTAEPVAAGIKGTKSDLERALNFAWFSDAEPAEEVVIYADEVVACADEVVACADDGTRPYDDKFFNFGK